MLLTLTFLQFPSGFTFYWGNACVVSVFNCCVAFVVVFALPIPYPRDGIMMSTKRSGAASVHRSQEHVTLCLAQSAHTDAHSACSASVTDEETVFPGRILPKQLPGITSLVTFWSSLQTSRKVFSSCIKDALQRKKFAKGFSVIM